MSVSRAISVLLADDHAVMRAGLRLLLTTQADMRVVGEAGTHQEVLEQLARLGGQVDVVTLDLTMPGGSPTRLIQDIATLHPATRVVVLTMHDDPSSARVALAAGARAYVVKSSADTELLSAIRAVFRGGIVSTVALGPTPSIGGGASRSSKGAPSAGTAIDSLSEREREVLTLVARGHTNQQIADRLFLSVKTIESYRSRLMTKLGFTNRAELTRFAIDTGMLDG